MFPVCRAKLSFPAADDALFIRLAGSPYDVIQFELVPTGTPAAGDQLEIYSVPETITGTPVLVTVPGSPFELASNTVLLLPLKTPRLKLVRKDAGGGATTALTVYVKTYAHGQYDSETESAWATRVQPGGDILLVPDPL